MGPQEELATIKGQQNLLVLMWAKPTPLPKRSCCFFWKKQEQLWKSCRIHCLLRQIQGLNRREIVSVKVLKQRKGLNGCRTKGMGRSPFCCPPVASGSAPSHSSPAVSLWSPALAEKGAGEGRELPRAPTFQIFEEISVSSG